MEGVQRRRAGPQQTECVNQNMVTSALPVRKNGCQGRSRPALSEAKRDNKARRYEQGGESFVSKSRRGARRYEERSSEGGRKRG